MRTRKPNELVEEIMERIRREIRRDQEERSDSSGGSTSSGRLPPSPAAPAFSEVPPIRVHDVATLPEQPEFHIFDLIGTSHRETIFLAYSAILRRKPTQQELEIHLGELRRERSTVIGMIGQLRKTPEGRHHGVKIRGAWRCHWEAVSRGIPLLGTLLSYVGTLITLPRKIGCLLNENQRLHQQIEELARDVDERQHGLQSSLKSLTRFASASSHYQSLLADKLRSLELDKADQREIDYLLVETSSLRRQLDGLLQALDPEAADEDPDKDTGEPATAAEIRSLDEARDDVAAHAEARRRTRIEPPLAHADSRS